LIFVLSVDFINMSLLCAVGKLSFWFDFDGSARTGDVPNGEEAHFG
jgi:hypothetical protein